MTSDMIIRQLTPDDARALLALQASCYPPELHDTLDTIAAFAGVVAVDAGAIVGAALVQPPSVPLLYSVEVAPSHRRRGLAAALIGAALPHGPAMAYALPGGECLLHSLGWRGAVDISGHPARVLVRRVLP